MPAAHGVTWGTTGFTRERSLLAMASQCGVGRADHRVDAGAGNVIDRDLEFLENAENSQMCGASGPFSAQSEADWGSMEGMLLPATAFRNDCGSYGAKERRRESSEPASVGPHPKPRVPFRGRSPQECQPAARGGRRIRKSDLSQTICVRIHSPISLATRITISARPTCLNTSGKTGTFLSRARIMVRALNSRMPQATPT
jgi:hypothetical protein